MAKIQWNNAAFAEICKSAGMRSLLGEHAARMAAGANSAALAHAGELREKRFLRVPYGSAVDTLPGTCVGAAFAKTKVATLMERKHKCLSSQNH